MNSQQSRQLVRADAQGPTFVWPSVLAEPRSGRVCWTHPTYDGVTETWRPRTRVVTSYATIVAFLEAKRAEGWEVEAFDEIATAPDGRRYPVVAVSLTRTVFGGAPQDDLLHVWVEPVAAPATEGRLEWRHEPQKEGPRERYVTSHGAFQAVVWREAASDHWYAAVTDLTRSTTIREWNAGDTRAQATSAAERTLATLNQTRAVARAR